MDKQKKHLYVTLTERTRDRRVSDETSRDASPQSGSA